MRVPITWLREYVDLPNDSQTIADRLAMLGFPVEEIVSRPTITGVVVGKILKLEKHPNADRLQIGTIDVGAEKMRTIATAATNVATGQVIPVALIGAQLPQLKIEPRKMRGIESEGMMVSADELALPAEWFEDGIMQLEADAPLGANVIDRYGLHDDILEVEVTTNRVDAMSILGLARELAASYGTELRAPSFDNPGTEPDPQDAAPRVTLESADCTRFVAQRFEGINVAPSPAHLRIRLALAGQRPINNVVDISNYVMLETAQPLHFYDAQRLRGGHLIARDAREGEILVTLDDAKHELRAQALVIADDGGPLGLAGLMGGESSEVRPSTTAIVLESANFNGARIRRMSMQLGLRTEASSRHEKALAPALTNVGAARAAQLLIQSGARAYRPHAFGEDVQAAPAIPLTGRDVERLLGLTLAPERIADHLRALGCTVAQSGERLSVVPPAWRRDLAISADLVEEVARMEGYDNIEAVVPSVQPHDIPSAQYDLEDRLADVLRGLGYDEIVTYSLHGQRWIDNLRRAGIEPSHKPVEVRNPLSEDQRFLRYAMGPGLMEHFARVDRPGRVFEIGHIFSDEEGLVTETPVLALGLYAEPLDEPAWQDSQFHLIKGHCETLIRRVTGREAETSPDRRNGLHPGKTAVLLIDGHEIANVGRIDPRVQKSWNLRLPLYFCNIYIDNLPDYRAPVYRPPSKFPSTYRDLALIVDLDVTSARIQALTASSIGSLCTGVRVLNEYRGPQIGEGKKSLATRITIQRFDATITDEEADAAVARALTALRDDLGATIRA